MSEGTPIRKQVYALTQDDLSQFPIWEFWLDEGAGKGQDESTVRPHTEKGKLNPTERMFIVRAAFTLADGSKMTGYLTPPAVGREGLGIMQPIIVTAGGQVRLWCGTAAPNEQRLARSYQLLGKDAKSVFPVRFESEVPLVDGPATGSAPGFLVLEDFQTRRTRTVA